jgi:hypothetical protein
VRVLAHAFGSRFDLPIPLWVFVVSGAVVVILSFLLVLPRRVSAGADEAAGQFEDAAYLRDTPAWLGALSVVVLAFLCWCGFAGSQEIAENIVPTVFWLLVWIAVPLSVALIGDWTQPVNPYLFLSRIADSPSLRRSVLGDERTLPWPRWLGWWPAVVLFLLAVLGELVFNLTVTLPQNTALALALYAVLSLLGGFFFGVGWRGRGEFWTVLFDTWGRIGYFRFGAPGRRGFAGGLERPFSRHVSRVVFVLLMLLNVNYDGLITTPQWGNDVERQLPGSWGRPGIHLELFRTVAFLLMVVVMLFAFGAFSHASAKLGRHGTRFLGSLSGLLPSVVPIAFGYLFAHNIEYILINAQLMAPLIGDPPGLASWPIHLPYPFNDDYEVSRTFLPSSFYWYAAVVVIIAVHVIAVVLAHRHLQRRAAEVADERVSELPWLIAMVGYTMLSLWLLAQPLIKETASTSGDATPRLPGMTHSINGVE